MPPDKIIAGASGKSTYRDNNIPNEFINKENKHASIIIDNGDLAMFLAAIAGITIMLVTSKAPTILIVDKTEKAKIIRNMNSTSLMFIPMEEATSLFKTIKIMAL